MGLALNLRQIVGQLLQLDVVGNGPQLKHNAGTMEVRNSTDTGFVITRGSDPVGNNDFVTKGAGDLAYWRSVNPNWLVTDWYIDGVTGDDTNSGTVIGSPIKTGAELSRRLGPYAIWPQSVTVHVLANGMIDALVLRGLMQVVGTHLDVIGTVTVLVNDVLAAYTPMNHATPIATQIRGTAITNWNTYRWKRVRNTTPARLGNIVWVAVENPGGVGVNTARVSVPGTLDVTSNLVLFTSGTAWVAGDTFSVEQLPFVPQITAEIDGPLWLTPGVTPQYNRRQLMIRDISVPFLFTKSVSSLGLTRTIIFGNELSSWSFGIPPTISPSLSTVYSCHIQESDLSTAQGTQLLVNSSSNCLYGSGFQFETSAAFVTLTNATFQGLQLNAVSAPINLISVQLFDMGIGGLPAATLKNANVQSLSGNGNAGYGVGLANGAQVTLAGTINLLGTSGNGRLVSSGTTLTYPQLLQPDDYAQKGTTPAMVAGTTTVTVLWYDNTTQRVTVSHAVFAGTPGILSVQQISNTQFTITSSSALDTSTVNWTISPLGRNIFISTV